MTKLEKMAAEIFEAERKARSAARRAKGHTPAKERAAEHAALLRFTRLLAGFDCAGPPACDDEVPDGIMCSTCEARAWLAAHDYGDRR